MGDTLDNLVEQADLTQFPEGCLDFDGLTPTISELTQLKIDKICAQEDLIAQAELQLQQLNLGNEIIEMDLGCLVSKSDPCENGNFYTLSEVFKVFKDSLCILRAQLTACCSNTQGTSGGSGTTGTAGSSGTSGNAGTDGGSSGTAGTSGNTGSVYTLAQNGICSGINSNYTIAGATIGDVIIVQATFGGIIQKEELDFTRADLTISSPDGTSDFVSSFCYSDTSTHPFNIIAQTTITTVGATALVLLGAVTNNSSESATSVTVSIISINGHPVNIFVPGCRGNSSTGGTC